MQQQWADYRVFWREFRRTFHTTGAVLPSGPALSRALARYVRESQAVEHRRNSDANVAGVDIAESVDSEKQPSGRRILEVGPGTGAVTTHIVRDLRPLDHLTLVERNEQFVDRLRQRLLADPAYQRVADRIELVHAGVQDLAEARPYELIISGLPLNNFSVPLVEQLVAKFRRLLAAGGTLSFFEYVAVRKFKSFVSRREERERLRGIGRLLADVLATSEVSRDLVLTNIPPAWVHHVRFNVQ